MKSNSKILDGKALQAKLTKPLIRSVKKLKVTPRLVIVQVGNEKESNLYIKKKKEFGEKIGALVDHVKYPITVSEGQIISDILRHNADANVHGIIVQLPVPKRLDVSKILDAIDANKDVDGLTSKNTKSIFDNEEVFLPSTTKGILTLLKLFRIDVVGKKIVIVGASSLVGRPTALAFLNRKATVTVCHQHTKRLERETKQADIIITAAGVPKLITRKHVSKKQIVVDIGISLLKNKKVVGDVDYDGVKNIVGAITPVPGGVGPMTVLSLFENLINAAENCQ